MTKKLVSIIIPSFNQGEFIRETIQSCLDQNYRPIEIIVQDGASTDQTVAILKSFNTPELLWLSESDKGVVDAVNKGISRAKGEILTIQSSDDVFLPGAISAAVIALQQNPQAGLVYGDVKHINVNSIVTGEDVQNKFDLAEYLGRFIYIPQPGTFFTRDALQVSKGWRAEYSYTADADFWLQIVTHMPIVCKLDRFLAAYRYHPGQRDTQKAAIARDWEGMISNHLSNGKLNAQQQRYAKMGIHLAKYRYSPENNWILRTYELYAAWLTNPFIIFDNRFPRCELFPGRTPIWAILSRVKKNLGFKPRTS